MVTFGTPQHTLAKFIRLIRLAILWEFLLRVVELARVLLLRQKIIMFGLLTEPVIALPD